MRCFSALLGLTAAALIAFNVPAAAQQPLARVGVFKCTGGPTAGFLVGSTTDLTCVLDRRGHRRQYYTARVNRFGVDLGVTDRWALAWNVLAPSPRLMRGGIGGSYAGAGASASIGVGASSNQLVGGPGGNVSLVPMDVDGQTGVNLAFGFQGMDIRRGR